jgi:hypothetical protein
MIVRELFAKLGFKVDDKGAKEFDERMDKLKDTLVKVGAAAAAAAAAVGAMVSQVVRQADLIDKASQATGVNTDSLQRLKYAADLSSVSFEKLQASLGFLNRAAFLAANGSKETGLAFTQLGIRVTDANGKLRPAEDMLGEISDRFAAMPDGTQKSALAMRVFGEAGAALVPLLNQGRAGISAMGDELVSVGGLMSPEQIRAGVALGDAVTRAKTAFFGLALTVAGPLLKPLNAVVDRLLAWWKANRDGIKLQVEETIAGIGKAFDVVWQKLRPLISGAGLLYDKLGGLKGMAAVVAAVVGLQLASALGGAALALGKFVAGLKLASLWEAIASVGPLTLGLAIGALILIIDEFVTALQGGDTLLGELFQKFAKAPDKEENWLVTFARAFWATWGDMAVEVPKALEWWKAKFIEFFDWLVSKIASANDAVGAAVKSGAKSLARGALNVALPGGAGNWVADKVFGGGAPVQPAVVDVSPMTPLAPPAGPRSSVRTFAPTIQVTATTGASPEDIAGAIDAKLRAHQEAWMRETAEDVG